MITVRFLKSGCDLLGYEISGHADYDDYGRDIVCASVSSAAYMTANTITEILGVGAECEVDESGRMKILLTGKVKSAVDIIKGFELHMNSLMEDYPDNINVIYGGVE